MKFFSQPINEPIEADIADDGRFSTVVAEHAVDARAQAENNACYVVSVALGDSTTRSRLAEILSLVEAQGDHVVGHETRLVLKPNPKTLLGRGQAEELGQRARACGANLLVIDAELSPSQMRNLEDATRVAVSDREAVILKVFQRHAKTKKAKIQVEIAHLQYLRPRIRGLGLEMDQQAGGISNARGPGETASELLARRLDKRLGELRASFNKLKHASDVQRRRRGGITRIALVGYTNAGKTSLMNAMTSAGLSAKDQPFETLETTSRCLTRHGGEVLVSDTVGFIRKLPERLLASFETTLAEAKEANLLVIVVDLSDIERTMHIETTQAMLQRLGAADVPRHYVFNKVDRCEDGQRPDAYYRMLSGGHPCSVLSTKDDRAVAALKRTLIERARGAGSKRTLFVPYAHTAAMSAVYARCEVHAARSTERGVVFELSGTAQVLRQIERLVRSTA